MALYAMADTHLSSSVPKSMEVFGRRWVGYTEKIEKRWRALVTDKDTVVIPGDVSWATSLEEAAEDFRFLSALPGKKLLGKGNHDFWWTTVSKMTTFFAEHGLDSLHILYNNAYLAEGQVLCGTRGWFLDERQQNAVGSPDYARVVAREVGRLRMSLEAAEALRRDETSAGRAAPPVSVFLHFPPVWLEFVCRELVDVLHEYDIKRCYFGHIHGMYRVPQSFEFEGITMTLCASDFLNFSLLPLSHAPRGGEHTAE